MDRRIPVLAMYLNYFYFSYGFQEFHVEVLPNFFNAC